MNSLSGPGFVPTIFLVLVALKIKMETMRKEGGDKWLSMLNADSKEEKSHKVHTTLLEILTEGCYVVSCREVHVKSTGRASLVRKTRQKKATLVNC